MDQRLVIVESPTKARTLKKFLGKGYDVRASVGHIIDLPKSKLGVDVEKNFAPHYITIRGKGKLLKELKQAAAKAKVILLATDPDREGEAISWHLSQALKMGDGNACRVLIPEFTKSVVSAAFKSPRKLDLDKVNSQQARRILDRLVGYKISPILWEKLQYGLSAGRVQSVALKIICDREQEVQAFEAREYWTIDLDVDVTGKGPLSLSLKKIDGADIDIKDEASAKAILDEVRAMNLAITSVDKTKRQQKPAAPFITSTLQQASSRRFGFSTKKTMIVAQQLYEGVDVGKRGPIGLITYMRTDSTRVSAKVQEETQQYLESKFGANYLPPSAPQYQSKKANVQDAHEAIRPTDLNLTPKDVKRHLTDDQYKLYCLIWTRYVASQVCPAEFNQTRIEVKAGKYLFRAVGRQMVFDGFLRIFDDFPHLIQRPDDALLPDAAPQDGVAINEEKPEQHFTQPPPRFTEASLVKTLEENGIGRPSTYSAIITTMIDRKYVEKREKLLQPSELGMTVVDLLSESFPNIMNVEFTAAMESELDAIEQGDDPWQAVLQRFYVDFEKSLAKAKEQMRNLKREVVETDITCTVCSEKMVIKRGRYGKFLACSGYPNCKNTSELPREGEEPAKRKVEFLDEKCEKCGSPMQLRSGRFGKFKACSDYPKCKNTKPLLNKIGVECPLEGCSGEVVSRFTRRKKMFYGCSNYPKCDFTSWVRPAPGKCPLCQTFLVEKRNKTRLQGIICSNRDCGYKQDLPPEEQAQAAEQKQGAEQKPSA